MSSLIAEKYLFGDVERKAMEERMFNGNLQSEYQKQWIDYLKRRGWYVEPDKSETIESE